LQKSLHSLTIYLFWSDNVKIGAELSKESNPGFAVWRTDEFAVLGAIKIKALWPFDKKRLFRCADFSKRKCEKEKSLIHSVGLILIKQRES